MMPNLANSTHNLASNVAGRISGKVKGPAHCYLPVAVSNVAGTASETALPIQTEVLSLFTMSDEKILDTIRETHVHADDSFDLESLFLVVQNIVKRSTQIVDNIVQGTQVHVETIDVKPPNTSFSSPLCTLKSIGSELSCKSPGEKIAQQSTLSILKKLSSYSWEAKAVLTLAAFALDYGEFWHLAQLHETDQIAKSFAILKRVPVLLKAENLQKRRQAIVELNGLIKVTLQVIEIILELEKFHSYNVKDVPGLAMALDHIPVDVCWAIITIVACATKIDILLCDEDKADHDLSTYSQKIHFILNKLNLQLKICFNHIAREKAYQRLKKIIQTSTEIVELIKALIFTEDIERPSIIIGHTKETVTIDVLRSKHVLLFLSSLDVSDDDINVLNQIYDGIMEENKYCIVWIPIVETWTVELHNKFDLLKIKMPWYVVQDFSSIFGIRFIMEEWQFKARSTFVKVINSQANVIYPNALHEFRLMGIEAFVLWESPVPPPPPSVSWIETVFKDIDANISTWIKEEKYIFFYGGNDDDWIQRFTSNVQGLLDSPILKEAKIDIKLCCVEKSGIKRKDIGLFAQFWTKINSLFFSNISYQQINLVTQEVQRLLSYKNEAGWALLSKGSTVVTNGHGFIVLKVVEELSEKLKDQVVNDRSFGPAFNHYYKKLLKTKKYCCRVDFARETEGIPTTMTCTECNRAMEAFISYKCCHIDGPLKEYHRCWKNDDILAPSV